MRGLLDVNKTLNILASSTGKCFRQNFTEVLALLLSVDILVVFIQ